MLSPLRLVFRKLFATQQQHSVHKNSVTSIGFNHSASLAVPKLKET